jgi:transposase
MEHSTPHPYWGQAAEGLPGVYRAAHGHISIHVIIDDHGSEIIPTAIAPEELAPANVLPLDHFTVFEDTVKFVSQTDGALVVHASAPEMQSAVVYFYRRNGTLQCALPLSIFNPGWVCGCYRFRGDLKKMDERLVRLQAHARPAPRQRGRTKPTLWQVSDWQSPMVYAPLALVERLLDWRHELSTQPQVLVAKQPEQVKRLNAVYPPDVAQVLAVKEQGAQKVTYTLGGIPLLLAYLERLGLAGVVDRYCGRVGEISEGTVFVVIVLNRLLFPLPLHHVGEWAGKVGLPLLLGIPDAGWLNYDRLVDTLAAVSACWEEIAADVTLNAVERFGLRVATIHYDLTSVFFHGAYQESEMVDLGYSRDHRPDKPQVVLALSTTADGEVPLPGACGVHQGNTQDVDTPVEHMRRLQATFRRTGLLVTGDRAMQSAENMLLISRAHGRFLGPLKLTDTQKSTIASIPEREFQWLRYSQQAGRTYRAVFRRFWFKVKEEIAPTARRRRRRRGRLPRYRQVRFWVRAAVLLDEDKRQRDAAQRERKIQEYESELDFCIAHLNKGRYYGDPKWVAEHLRSLEEQYKAVSGCVHYRFAQQEGQMTLTYWRDEQAMARAARLDGKWLLVSNQPLAPGQSQQAYMDWMLRTYKAHAAVERRMRNLKSDLPIRPLYVHRDDHITGLCFASLLALTVYALLERDCKRSAELVAADLDSARKVLWVWWGYSVTGVEMPSGNEVLWEDTLTKQQRLILTALGIPDPGTRLPDARQATERPVEASTFCLCSMICHHHDLISGCWETTLAASVAVRCKRSDPSQSCLPMTLSICVLVAACRTLTLCYAENELQDA